MGVIAFVGCERPEPIDPNEVQQQQTVDTVITIPDFILTYFIGEWECIDRRYSNHGGLFLSFSRDSLFTTNNATIVSQDPYGNNYEEQLQSIFDYPPEGCRYRVAVDTSQTDYEYVIGYYGDSIPNNPVYALRLDIDDVDFGLAMHIMSNDTILLYCLSGVFCHDTYCPATKYNLKRIR